MTRKRIRMDIQQQITQLKEQGKTKSEIARRLGVNRETVRHYWTGPPENSTSPSWSNDLNWDYVVDQLKSKVSRKILYEELSQDHQLPDYSNFCRQLFNRLELVKKSNPKITMKVPRQMGYSTEVDYSGDSLEIINPATGEIIKLELFVGALTYRSYFYAAFTPSQKLEDFIDSHTRMFEFFGGVTEFVVPDNCLTAVTKAEKHDPRLNESYSDLCRHYRVVVDPARVRRPQDKPVVEKSIGILQSDFFPRVRNKTFTSLFEINLELKKYLHEKMKVTMKERGKSRLELFELEKTHLGHLPVVPYEFSHFKVAKVHPNCHIQLEKNFYSVPHQHVGQEVIVKFNQKLVQVYRHTELLCTHTHQKGTGHYATIEAHYPEKKLLDANFHLSLCRIRSSKIGENMQILCKRLIEEPRHPLKNLSKLQGVLALADAYGEKALEEAVGMALELERLQYAFIKQCTKNWRPENKAAPVLAPRRQLEFICLQGGRS